MTMNLRRLVETRDPWRIDVESDVFLSESGPRLVCSRTITCFPRCMGNSFDGIARAHMINDCMRNR